MDTSSIITMVVGTVAALAIVGAVKYVLDSLVDKIKGTESNIDKAKEVSEKGDQRLMDDNTGLRSQLDEVKRDLTNLINATRKDLHEEIQTGVDRVQVEVENRRKGEIKVHEKLDAKIKNDTDKLERDSDRRVETMSRISNLEASVSSIKGGRRESDR